MAELVRFEAGDGSFMWVETTGALEASRLDLVVKREGREGSTAVTRLEDSLASVRGAAVALMATVDELKKRQAPMALNEVSMDLALSLGIEGGVIVAKGSAKAEASVTLTWRRGSPTS
jgi:thymidine phosphorylase